MLKRSVVSILLCCGVVLLTSAQPGNSKTKSVSIFSIGKKPIEGDEFIYLYRKNHQNKPEEFTKEKIEEYLDLFINFKLKVTEALHRGLDTTAAFRKEYNTYREELRKPYLPDTRLVDSLVELTYARMKEEIKASHILINLKPDPTPEDTARAYEKIMELRNRILKGEDFEAVAFASSEDPTAKMNKGNLGYFTAMQMVFPFEQVAYNTKIGSISMPLRTRFGYHIIKVTDRKPARGEVEVSHIMLRTGEGFENEKAKNTIFEIYDQLQKGVNWDDLSREYSQDLSAKDKGGRLRPFGVGAMTSVPEFEQIAFALQKPGDISDPFETQYGWHIIRLETKIPLPSFDELAPSLKTRVSRDERIQISKQALQSKIKKEFGYSENPAAKATILTLADTSLNTGKWNKETGEEGNQILFTMLERPYPVKDFLSYVRNNQKPNALAPEQYLMQLYDNYVDDIHGQLLEEKIARENPDYSWLLKEYYEGILLFEIMEKEVWNKATDDSTGQRKYFDDHSTDYNAGERIKGKIFSSSLKSSLEQLMKLVEEGDSAKIQEFVSAQKIRQETGAFEKNDRPVLGKVNWATGAYLTENNGLNYLVWIKSILPPGRQTFEEARPSVVSDYQNYLEKKWLERLKKKYPIKVNKKGKQFVLQQLVKR